jgi:hypothetical protein
MDGADFRLAATEPQQPKGSPRSAPWDRTRLVPALAVFKAVGSIAVRSKAGPGAAWWGCG